ncbi:hypothetical protein [Pseudomonas sp. KU43P]|uniref:hypothetical protein n=1 Tax=Pseudomonas sp. KU43P TaxID=2487887 RepID=UPI0029547F26|nr:hypothetical protein [Pseudomonas sp. KU43P]
MLLMALLVLPIGLASYVDSMWLMVGLLSLAAAAHQGWSANLFTTVADNFPRAQVASVMGIGGTAGSVGGMIFALMVGLVLEHYKIWGQLNLGYNLIFIAYASAYVVAWVSMRVLARPLGSAEPAPGQDALHRL